MVGGIKRQLKPALIGASLALIALLLSSAAWFSEREKLQLFLDTAAQERARSIQTSLSNELEFLNLLTIYFSKDEDIIRDDFDRLVKDVRTHHPALRSVMWVPKVLHADRANFIATQRQQESGFNIIEHTGDGGAIAAPVRPYYLPITQLDSANRATRLGFDLASNPLHVESTTLAARFDKTVISSTLPLNYRKTASTGFLVFKPVYKGAPTTNAARETAVRGFFVAAIDVSTLVALAIRDLPDNFIEFTLVETLPSTTTTTTTANPNQSAVKTLFSQNHNGSANGFAELHTKVAVGDKYGLDWHISARPGHAFSTVSPYVNALFIGALGALILLLAIRYIRHTQGRENLINEIVATRTAELNVAHRKLEATSLTDALTGLSNRRHLDKELEREWARAMRENGEIAIAIIDVDHFKRFNDRYGHVAGDKVLASVSNILSASFRRPCDIVARYGGEEFMVVLPSNKDAVTLIEKLVYAFERVNIPHGDSPTADYVTISAGLALCSPLVGDALQVAIQKADSALYTAKSEGRNRMHCWSQNGHRLEAVA